MADVIYSGSVGGTGMPSSYSGNGSYGGVVLGHNSSNFSTSPPISSSDYHTGATGSNEYLDELYNANMYNRERYYEANAHNRSLYNDSLDWYERMQNSSIQRMVEDMKRAGINPVLAGRYGGYNVSMPNAPYNNNMPYLDVSSLGSYESSHYATDIGYIETMASLSISEKNVLKQCETQIFNMLEQVQGSKDVASIYASSQKYVADTTNSMKEHIQDMYNNNQIDLQDMRNKQSDIENWRNNIDATLNEVLRQVPNYHREFFTPAGVLGLGRSYR